MRRWGSFMYAVALLAAVIAGVGYTNYVQHESERKWCGILVILTTGPAPETERGRAIAAAMIQLRRDFGC